MLVDLLFLVFIKQTFSAYDDLFLITDLYTVVRLNNWEKDQVGGLEIEVSDYALLEQVNDNIRGLFDEKE